MMQMDGIFLKCNIVKEHNCVCFKDNDDKDVE